eukprot:COSAG01_NODE_31806_length_591_cov_0.739837_1_plen_41_part_10
MLEQQPVCSAAVATRQCKSISKQALVSRKALPSPGNKSVSL